MRRRLVGIVTLVACTLLLSACPGSGSSNAGVWNESQWNQATWQ